MTTQYVIQKNRDTTQIAGATCHCIITGDGLTDADCADPDCCGNHPQYRNPVWQVRLVADPDSEDADNYTFGVGDMAMTVPKPDCFTTRELAESECDSRNA